MPLLVKVLTDDAPDGGPSVVVDSPRVVLGRAESADVILPDPSVSPRHATLREHGASWLVQDEGSTNGTWVSGVRLSPGAQRVIADGDEVRIGRVWLRIGTRPTEPASPREATRTLALSLVRRALAALGEPADPVVTVREGPDAGKTLTLTGTHVLGRGPASDLVLDEPDASRRHLEVSNDGGVVRVTDLGAKNGVFLGERRLEKGKPVAWAPDDELHVGADVLELTHASLAALAEIGRGEDEKVPESRLPDRPGAPTTPTPEPAVPEETPLTAAARAVESATGWGSTDAMVVLFAVLVLAASAAGLLWLFK